MEEIAKKVQEMRLMWYWHVIRREEHYVGKRAVSIKVLERRKRGKPKRRWLDRVRDHFKEKGLLADDCAMSTYIDTPYNMKRKKKEV